jgi:MFS transporter, ACS family, hexuronate transporter
MMNPVQPISVPMPESHSTRVAASTPEASPRPAGGTIKHLRWWIAGLLAIATALNYLDRQSFPVVVNEVRKEIPISNEQYGQLTSLFLLAYAIMYAGGGRIMDWLGARVGYTVMIVWWSAANVLTGTVSSVFGIGTCRFLLGMGEGGGFPGSGKVVAEWFPAKERAMAFGIFNTGSSIGAVIAPLLIAQISTTLGWRWVFYITGSVGFVWAWIWLKYYQPPATNRFLSNEERALVPIPTGATVHAASGATVSAPPIPWLKLFTYREVIALMSAKFMTDAAWYFFIFWLPKYLGDVRHLDIKQIGYFAWIPYAAAGAGSLIGGWLSGYLMRRGISLNVARKIALGVSASLLPASIFIVAAPLNLAIVFFSTAMFAHQFWSANVQTLPADLFPSKVVGSVEGLLGCAGGFGGILFASIGALIVERTGYGPVFFIAGVLHPLAFIIIISVIRQIRPVVGR